MVDTLKLIVELGRAISRHLTSADVKDSRVSGDGSKVFSDAIMIEETLDNNCAGWEHFYGIRLKETRG